MGLQQPDRAAVTAPALVELLQLVVDELLHPALLELGDGGALEAFEELRVTFHQPSVEEGGADGVVLPRELDALLQRPGGVARLQPRVPERTVQVLGDGVRPLAGRLVAPVRQEREQVDVRAGGKLAPSISARRDEREGNRAWPGELLDDRA